MSLLLFPDGEYFATGAINYAYRPAITSETTNRIIIVVSVEDSITEAVLDTGAPYPIISPKIAKQAGLNRVKPLERTKMVVRKMKLEGSIIRLNMTLTADNGKDLTVNATAFIPDSEECWGDFPCFIGQLGFLERIRYAVGPATDTFYLGTL